MQERGLSDACPREARLACAHTKVEILESEKVPLVEQPDALEDLAADQHRATADTVDRPYAESGATGAGEEITIVAHSTYRLSIRDADRLDPFGIRILEDDRTDDAKLRRGVESVFERAHRIKTAHRTPVETQHGTS